MFESVSEMKDNRDPYLIEDCPSYKINGTDWIIQGYSVSGNRTGFNIECLKLFLDGGLSSNRDARHVLLTHSHLGHTRNVPKLVTNNNTRTDIYCPREMVDPLRFYCKTSSSLHECKSITNMELFEWNDLIFDQKFELEIKKKRSNVTINVTTVKCYHSVPTVGYIFSVKKKKLKAGFIGKTAKQLQDIQKRKIEVYNYVMEKKFAFLGDTSIKVFENRELLQTPAIFVECTFVDKNISEKDADEKGHIHWQSLEPIVKSHPKTTFILMHFDNVYREDFLTNFFDKVGLANVVLWLKHKVKHFVNRQQNRRFNRNQKTD